MRDAYAKTTKKPAFPDKEAAQLQLQTMLRAGSLFVAVDRTTNPKHVMLATDPAQQQTFDPDSYYVWVYEGEKWKGMLMVKQHGLVVVIMI